MVEDLADLAEEAVKGTKEIIMKKNFKNLLKILMLIFFMVLPQTVLADDFESIDMEISIDKNGLGHVKEVWQVYDDDRDATEKYKSIPDLRGIKIEDFKLNANGKDFSEISPWNLDASFDEKSNHYGVLEKDDGYELCWGITNYGENTYTLTYTINPLVVSLNDCDMVHFRFIGENFDPKPEKISIKIKGYAPFDKEVKMWGFGFIGDIHNVDGEIIAKSTDEVNYGHIMLKFPKGTFNSSYVEDKDFEYYAKKAIVGSDYEKSEGTVDQNDKSDIMEVVFAGVVILIIIIAGAIFTYGVKNSYDEYQILNKKALKKPKELKEQYFREIPYKGPIEDTYLLADKAYPLEDNLENYLNAFLLKWIYDGAIDFNTNADMDIKDEDSYITINNKPSNMSEIESGFFEILQASEDLSDDEKIKNSNIEDYMDSNEDEIEKYFKLFEENSLEKLEENSYLTNERKEIKSSFIKEKTYKNKITITDSGINLYENFIKFKNYLADYSLIKERDINEVKLRDSFMIYAAIYGISKEVYKNFTEIYPEYENYSIYNYYMINNINSYSSHIAESYADLTSFIDAGSGGSTSFGGGGGGFGGGGGGGSR